MRDWKKIAGKLSKDRWTLGSVATIDSDGRTIFVVDAHREDGKGRKSKQRIYRTCRTALSTSKLAPSLRGPACGLGRAPIGFFRLWCFFRRGLEFRGISFPI